MQYSTKKERNLIVKKYNVKIRLYKNIRFEVTANDEKQAFNMVKDVIENISIEDIDQYSYEIKNINIEEEEAQNEISNAYIPFVKVQK